MESSDKTNHIIKVANLLRPCRYVTSWPFVCQPRFGARPSGCSDGRSLDEGRSAGGRDGLLVKLTLRIVSSGKTELRAGSRATMSPHRALAADTALAIVVLLDLLSSGSGAEPPELSNGGPFCDWNLTLRDTNPLVDEADQHYLSLGEASPVIFQTNTEPKTTVLVCRTPKVGSLLVRSLALAYVTGQPYRTLPNTDLRFHTNSSMTIAAKGPEEGYRLLTTNDGVTRIMFAR